VQDCSGAQIDGYVGCVGILNRQLLGSLYRLEGRSDPDDHVNK